MGETCREINDFKTFEPKGYLSFLGAGIDTLSETFDMTMQNEPLDRMEQAKIVAQNLDQRGGAVSTMEFGGEYLQVQPSGGRQGVIYRLSCPDFALDIRSPKTNWAISVRYSAAGLWQYGFEALRARVHKMLCAEFSPRIEAGNDWVHLSGIHIAFDFYSPKFTREMRPEIIGRVICHSSSKQNINFKIEGSAWGRAGRIETLTIGSKKSLEIQVYDKGREIREASGKEWMVKHWEREGYHPPEGENLQHIWRLEIRFGRDFLRPRNIDTLEAFFKQDKEIITEALRTKRLTVYNKRDKKNPRRWAMHPLWSRAWRETGAAVRFVPLGRQSSLSDEEKREYHISMAAAHLRGAAVAGIGDCDDTDFKIYAQEAAVAGYSDEQHEKKVVKLQEKMKFLKVAR